MDDMKKIVYADDLKQAIVEDRQIRGKAFAAIMRHLQAAPAVNAKPVVNGQWIICSDGYYPYCSVCKAEPKHGEMTDYCPKCGTQMSSRRQEE